MSNAPHHPRKADTGRRLVRALFQWRWSAIGFFLVLFGLLMAVAFVFPPQFEATGKVLVKPGGKDLPSGLTFAVTSGGLITSPMENIVSEVEIILSRPVLERTVDRLLASQVTEPAKSSFGQLRDDFLEWCRSIGLLPTIDRREALILQLAKKLGVQLIPGTHVLEISFRWTGKSFARDTVQFAIEEYLKQHAVVHGESGAMEFFDGQAAGFKAQLDQLQGEITAFQLQTGGDLDLQRTLLVEELVREEQQLRQLESIAAGEEELLAGSSVLANPQLDFYFQLLRQLHLDRSGALFEYGPSSKEIAGLDQRIATARKDLAEQLSRSRDFLAHKVANLRERVQEIERKRGQLEVLNGRRIALENSYRRYNAKAEEERTDLAMGADQLVSAKVVQWPTEPSKPWFPDKALLAIIGLVLGIPAALTFALLRGYLHGRVSSVEDVEQELGAPVLAAVPKMSARALAQARHKGLAQAARAVLSAAEHHGVQVLHVGSARRKEGAESLAAAVANEAVLAGDREVVLAWASPRGKAPQPAAGVQTLDLSGMKLAEQQAALAEQRRAGAFVVLCGTPLAAGDGGLFGAMADASLLVVSGSGAVHLEVARRGLKALHRFSDRFLGAVLTQRRDYIPGFLYQRI